MLQTRVKKNGFHILLHWLLIGIFIVSIPQTYNAQPMQQVMSVTELKNLMNKKNFEILTYESTDFNNDSVQDYILGVIKKGSTSKEYKTVYLLLVDGKLKKTITSHEADSIISAENLKAFKIGSTTHFFVDLEGPLGLSPSCYSIQENNHIVYNDFFHKNTPNVSLNGKTQLKFNYNNGRQVATVPITSKQYATIYDMFGNNQIDYSSIINKMYIKDNRLIIEWRIDIYGIETVFKAQVTYKWDGSGWQVASINYENGTVFQEETKKDTKISVKVTTGSSSKVNCYSGTVTATDQGGKIIWSHRYDDLPNTELPMISNAYIQNDNVFIIINGILTCFNKYDGEVIWTLSGAGGGNELVFINDHQLALTGSYGPHLMIVTYKENQVIASNIYNYEAQGFIWPSNLRVQNNTLKMTVEIRQQGLEGTAELTIDLNGKIINQKVLNTYTY